MDVHRARFVPYPASPITALAFSRPSDSGYEVLPALRLALGRANGSIEIWNPQRGAWVHEGTLPGGETSSVEALQWIQEPDESDAEGKTVVGQLRLFSIGCSPAVTEWDLASGEPARQSTGNFSEVWCFAAQPRWRAAKGVKGDEYRGQELVAGCGDGALVVLSTADGDLQFKRFLARSSGRKSRCMCIAYQNRATVVAGFADGVIRIYDTRSGSLLRNMSLGVGVPGAPRSALVWQVKCLPGGDIVSADSNGEVRFWDGKNYSMLQRLAAHDTDCLELATSADGKTVFSGSMDGKMAVFNAGRNGERNRWAKISHRRMHSGEVKAMASFDSKALSVVMSGGSDTSPLVTPLREFGKENHRTLPNLPQDPPVASAPSARLLVTWWERSVYIWAIASQQATANRSDTAPARKLVAKIAINGTDNVRSVTISSDGRALAASTSKEVKVFQLRRRPDAAMLTIRKLELQEELATSGARLVAFSPDGKWLAAVTLDSELQVVRLAPLQARPKLLRVVDKVVELDRRRQRLPYQSGLKEYERTITRLVFAHDSSVLVASDLSGYLDSWVLVGHEDLTAPALDIVSKDSAKGSSAADDADSDSDSDSDDDEEEEMVIFYGQHWGENQVTHLLPKLDSAPLVLSFRPSTAERDGSRAMANGNPGVPATRRNPHTHSHQLPHGQHVLWIMTARHQMYEFDVTGGGLTDWSRRNPTPTLPDEFKGIKDRVMGGVWDVTEVKERLWLYGSNWMCMLDVEGDLRADDGEAAAVAARKKRRRRSDGAEGVDEVQARKRHKGSSGAGDKVEAYETSVGPQALVSRVEGQAPDLEQRADGDSEADGADGPAFHLQRRRDKAGGGQGANAKAAQTRWWCTYKYRPVLGMVPLGVDTRRAPDRPLEVLLVERPRWDAQGSNAR